MTEMMPRMTEMMPGMVHTQVDRSWIMLFDPMVDGLFLTSRRGIFPVSIKYEGICGMMLSDNYREGPIRVQLDNWIII